MTADPRAALSQLTLALERHLEACAVKRGDDDPNVAAAYEDVVDAFELYDDALLQAYDEMTPLDVYADDDEDDLDEDEDGDDDERYTGFDDDEYDDEDEDEDDDDAPGDPTDEDE